MEGDQSISTEEMPPEIDDKDLGGDFDALDDSDSGAAVSNTESDSANTESEGSNTESDSANTESNTESDSANTASNSDSGSANTESEGSNTESNTESNSASGSANTESNSQSRSTSSPAPAFQFGDIKLPEAWDPAKVSPAKLVENILKDIQDVEVDDDEAEGGKAKLGDVVKDTPQFQQITAAITAAMINNYVAPIQKAVAAMLPAFQQQNAASQREGIIQSLVGDEKIENAREILDSEDEFWKWHDQQPEEVQNLASSINPKSVAQAIRLFQAETGKFMKKPEGDKKESEQKDKAKKDLENAGNLHRGSETSRRTGAPTGGSDTKKLEDEFDSLDDEI